MQEECTTNSMNQSFQLTKEKRHEEFFRIKLEICESLNQAFNLLEDLRDDLKLPMIVKSKFSELPKVAILSQIFQNIIFAFGLAAMYANNIEDFELNELHRLKIIFLQELNHLKNLF